MNVVALVDCNSFYASCEAIFKPHLKNQPVVVLSNNDGCVIARSSLAKKVGIKMGVPFFEVKELIKTEKVIIPSQHRNIQKNTVVSFTLILLDFLRKRS